MFTRTHIPYIQHPSADAFYVCYLEENKECCLWTQLHLLKSISNEVSTSVVVINPTGPRVCLTRTISLCTVVHARCHLYNIINGDTYAMDIMYLWSHRHGFDLLYLVCTMCDTKRVWIPSRLGDNVKLLLPHLSMAILHDTFRAHKIWLAGWPAGRPLALPGQFIQICGHAFARKEWQTFLYIFHIHDAHMWNIHKLDSLV